jgi:hypothetical protein
VPRFGRFKLELKHNETDEWDVTEAAKVLLGRPPADLAMWRGLSSWARIRLSVAVTLESFNQGISIDPVLVRQLADREMQLDIDFYAGDENETERHGPRGPKLRLVPRKKSRDLSYRAAMDSLTRTAHAKRVPLLGREPMPMTADYADAVRNHRFDLLYVEGNWPHPLETIPKCDHLLIENVAVSPPFQGDGITTLNGMK